MPTHVAKCGLGAAWRRTGWQPHACPLHPRAGGGTRLHLQTSTAMGGRTTGLGRRMPPTAAMQPQAWQGPTTGWQAPACPLQAAEVCPPAGGTWCHARAWRPSPMQGACLGRAAAGHAWQHLLAGPFTCRRVQPRRATHFGRPWWGVASNACSRAQRGAGNGKGLPMAARAGPWVQLQPQRMPALRHAWHALGPHGTACGSMAARAHRCSPLPLLFQVPWA